MNISIDLTKHNFDRINFMEAEIIDLYCQYELPKSLEFSIWGAILLLDPYWDHVEKFDSTLPDGEDLYVAGIGNLKIDQLIGGKIEVFIYDHVKQNGITKNAKNCDGTKIILTREWPLLHTDGADEYLWECVINWPYGYCRLNLFSDDGKVTFLFNSDDLISENAFRTNHKLYGFRDRNIKG
ncbi:hypothetical protein PaecuDRAFT_4470 [Paenibacillus curdlanolyticus YK9]|uniref:Uncharacterized protein n=1 Tax=Paenibacillus curdlanolyticus YK9 TaxID=717606 RepID=E0IFL0_9BACL|nr:hypothetical protein [Paenibacillus curdlanolyticus]EFM08676.1 hypothetical protein PaecuDRAFT_4470 [Paenibacillus curdlanolyticus YK9]